MFFFDPLDQFSIFLVLKGLSSSIWDVDNVSLIGFLNFVIIIGWVMVPWSFSNLRNWSKHEIGLHTLIDFCKGILHENVNMKHNHFLSFILIVYLFILVSNMCGMVPFSLTVTSYLIVAFFYSMSTFIALNIMGIIHNRAGIWRLFLPEGIPLAISIFLILIEIISYFSKVFSLSIRLFANMMSGHTLLKILISFAWTIIWLGFAFSFVSIIPMSVVFLTIGLEFVIAFLQAYVYIILLTIYLNDLINLH